MKRRPTPSQFSTSIYLAQSASRSGVTQHLPPSGFGLGRSFTRANLSGRPATSEPDDASSQAGRWIFKKFSLPFEPLGPRRSREIEKSERARRDGEREARRRGGACFCTAGQIWRRPYAVLSATSCFPPPFALRCGVAPSTATGQMLSGAVVEGEKKFNLRPGEFIEMNPLPASSDLYSIFHSRSFFFFRRHRSQAN